MLAISTFCNFNRRTERAGEKMLCNFNVFAISTFPKSLECSNFDGVVISTFRDLQSVCNFYGLQFPHARGARKRKIAHLVCLYKAETTSRPPQARKIRLRVPLARGECLELVRRKVGFLAISTRARSAPAEIFTTISTC